MHSLRQATPFYVFMHTLVKITDFQITNINTAKSGISKKFVPTSNSHF